MSKSRAQPAVIVSSSSAEWASCRIITPNLEQSYRLRFGEKARYFSFTLDMTPAEIWQLAQNIFASRPDRLVFLDHMPHPGALLRGLAELYGRRPLPPLYVHVYGDFTLYSRDWLEVEDILKHTQVLFICASRRQMGLVSRFLTEPQGAVKYCPFPVNRASYFSDETIRMKWRERLGLAPDEFAILYTGRISLQKNSIRLVDEVISFARQGAKPVLLMAGTFDDLGAPFFGVKLKKGYYFQKWDGFVRSLSSADQRVIRYLGQLGAEDLRGVYNASDLYFSLSLHHDEDYGMSPAEALCCGSPCVLTSWGGYASFVLDDSVNAVQLVPVQLGVNGIQISSTKIQQALLRASSEDQSPRARNARSEAYLDALSVEAVEQRVREFHEELPPAFQGFNWLMQRHAEMIKAPVVFPAGPKKGTFYEEIYGAYIQG